MTLDQKIDPPLEETINGETRKETTGKLLRPKRSRRHTRRGYSAGHHRPQKKLFTPEIKRFLKDWLVRRRDNPYPNREEKKFLARETGLTYIQICNWFANWRRKLKNVNMNFNEHSWGHLIRSYNDRAQGNVEQFSISSDDSIWSEPDPRYKSHEENQFDNLSGCPNFITERVEFHEEIHDTFNFQDSSVSNKCNESKIDELADEYKALPSPIVLSKWLESAARFQPSVANYACWADGRRRRPEGCGPATKVFSTLTWTRRDRSEVEAAVALTALAGTASPLSVL